MNLLPETVPPGESLPNAASTLLGKWRKKTWIINAVTFIYFCFLLFMLLHPDPWSFFGIKSQNVSISGFSILHLLVFTLLALGTELGRTRLPFLFWLSALLLIGPATEYLQILTGRGFEWIDIIEDTVGVTLGMALGYGLRRLPLMRRIVPPLGKDGINGRKGE